MLIEIIISGIIALILGLILVYTAKKLEKKTDPKIKKVYNVLPGVNCGGCGFGGCMDFAEAVVKDHSLIHGCVVGKNEVAEKIGKILDIKVSDVQLKIARVHCQGGKNCKDRFQYEGINHCNAVHTLMDIKQCDYGCIGFGDCVEACKYGALSMSKDGFPVVNPKKCVGCGQCVKACPKNIISLQGKKKLVHVACSNHDSGKEVRPICTKGCIACGICEKNCPTKAITVKDNLAVIDPKKCINCGLCVRNCPVKCINIIKK